VERRDRAVVLPAHDDRLAMAFVHDPVAGRRELRRSAGDQPAVAQHARALELVARRVEVHRRVEVRRADIGDLLHTGPVTERSVTSCRTWELDGHCALLDVQAILRR
jgi:hypothetical protein